MSHTQLPNKTFTSATLGADVTLSGGGGVYDTIVSVSITPRRDQKVRVIAIYQYDGGATGSAFNPSLFRGSTQMITTNVAMDGAGRGLNKAGGTIELNSDITLVAGTTYTFSLRVNGAGTIKASVTKIGVLWAED